MPTAISWTDETWNPTRGCRPVSPGCANCYAEEQAAAVNRRFRGMGKPEPYAGLVELRGKNPPRPRWSGAGRLVRERLADPLRWGKARRVFVDSMSDLFYEGFTNEEIAAVFGVMTLAKRHTFQVLTKRPERARDWFRWAAAQALYRGFSESQVVLCAAYDALRAAGETVWSHEAIEATRYQGVWPLPNVWLGVSVEDQERADERIPLLIETPAAVRFLSMEPLLGPVDLGLPRTWLVGATARKVFRAAGGRDESAIPRHLTPPPSLDWVIAGAESGRGARPAVFTWFRSLRDQCAAAGVPFFLKQAERTPGFYTSPETATTEVISIGEGSHRKRGGIVELPYLDGVQHAAFPEVARG